MGAQTLQTLIDEGLLEAGNSAIETRAKFLFKQWLRSQAAGFRWPQIHREIAAVPLGSSVQRVSIGAGANGVAERVQLIDDPIKLYKTDGSAYADVRVQTQWAVGNSTGNDVVIPAAQNSGRPSYCRVLYSATVDGRWDMVFDKVADQAYLLQVSLDIMPADPADAAAPWYPNDRTMVQAVNALARKYMRADDWRDEMELAASMVLDDRMKYGIVPGKNDVLALDSRTYR